MNVLVEQINTVCKRVRLTHTNPITFKKLVYATKKEFKLSKFDIDIKTKKDKNLADDEFYINAYYDAEADKEYETPIEVIIYYNFDQANLFSTVQITEFLVQVFDAVIHEYRHQTQSYQRNFITFEHHNDYKSYLKDPDEVDAYALSIAIDLLRAMPKARAKKYLSRVSVLSKMRKQLHYISPTLQTYIAHFGLCPLTKRMSKKIYKHLESIDTESIFM